jgi:hypothetical protein
VRLHGARALVALFVLSLPLVTPRLRGADEIEYFAYLRSLAFDGDLDFANEYRYFYERDPQGLAGFRETFMDRREPLTGRPINFAPLGSALLWSPLYLAAHAGVVAARAAGSAVPADGLAWPYEAAACYASAVYGLLGLLLTLAALRRFGGYAEPAATWAVAGLWLGTPLLYYMTIAPGFSHASSLFAVALVVWLSLRRWHEGPGSVASWVGVGAATGLAALVREQDGLFIAIPAVVLAQQTLHRRRWREGLARALALGGAAFAVFTPQMLAYHALNGSFGPSRMVARKMSYTSPHFLEVLIDPGHGLFVWSPLLLLATLAHAARAVRREAPAVLLALGLLLQVWINGSLESWTQAGAFGSRRFVGATPVFAWGLAALLVPLLGRFRRALVAFGLAVFVWWNVSLMVQFGLKLMDRQRLEWPRVAVNQVREVPRHFGRAAWMFFADRERLVKEGP